MSYLPSSEPDCPETVPDAVETLIVPRARDLGGFEVRRALPATQRQMVGPFIFFDQFGPAEILKGTGMDVRPHPHIGLATVTYLLSGEVHHQDSLGTDQVIRPGEVNWMIAGRGITHSERTPDALRERDYEMYGIQTWVALPDADEETDPGFQHVGSDGLPEFDDTGWKARLVLGSAYGERVAVKTFTEMFYVDVLLEPGAKFPLPDDHEDRGAYVLDGSIEVGGQCFERHRMLVFRPNEPVAITAGPAGARVMLLGGETLDGPRYIFWNFVASSKDKLEAAKEAWKKADWANGRFKLPPNDHDEYIPL